MKYLAFDQLNTNLRLGKSVEQWLGFETKEDYVILKWISIGKEKDNGYCVIYIECFDEGSKEFLDIYEFSMIDPDEPLGVINSFTTLEKAIEFTIAEYGATRDKFVNSGMIQNAYLEYLKNSIRL